MILKVLISDKSHPTIKEIYNKVHLLDKTIGQATVYRNVNKLVNSGKIKKLSINNEIDHYDGDVSNHYHFICTSCNNIVDIFNCRLNIPIKEINKKHGILIEESDIILYGKCNKCIK